MKILAIETSCDETAIALVEAMGGLVKPKFKILKNLVASQIKIHQPFGGVVPNLAKREHLKNLPVLLAKLQTTNDKLQTIDLIGVTVGPGLEPALWTGINFAKELHRGLRTNPEGSASGRIYGAGNQRLATKLIGVNHLEGHLYSNILPPSHKATDGRSKSIGINKKDKLFPAIALIISGGHTGLLLMKDLIHYKKLGETRDDAVGESFDKVARLLSLPYPGGPEIEKIAKYGSSTSIDFPRPMIHQKNHDFSFSGLKTSVLYYLRDNFNLNENTEKIEINKADIAASFQQAAFDVLITKTLRAAKEFKAKSIMVSGGVAANKTLQKEFKKAIKNQSLVIGCKLLVTKYPTDNAVMIAAAAYINFLRNKKYKLSANGNLGL